MILKLGMTHGGTELYKVHVNHNPGMTFVFESAKVGQCHLMYKTCRALTKRQMILYLWYLRLSQRYEKVKVDNDQEIAQLNPRVSILVFSRSQVSVCRTIGPQGFTASPFLLIDCDKTFTNKTGTIESPKLPFWTPYMMICVYKINRPAGERIKISFQTVDFKDTNCIREFLEVS